MKKILQTSTLFALTAFAALADNQISVPFGFAANGVKFPAGDYSIRREGLNPTGPIYRLQNKETGMTRFVSAPVQLGPAKKSTPGSHMVFACESGCELKEIWLASSGSAVN
jgi:hypothetical protein